MCSKNHNLLEPQQSLIQVSLRKLLQHLGLQILLFKRSLLVRLNLKLNPNQNLLRRRNTMLEILLYSLPLRLQLDLLLRFDQWLLLLLLLLQLWRLSQQLPWWVLAMDHHQCLQETLINQLLKEHGVMAKIFTRLGKNLSYFSLLQTLLQQPRSMERQP